MTSRLNPYINFADQAREALEFYAGVLGGTPVISTFGDFGQADAPYAGLVMHGMLETDLGFTLMVSDTPPGMFDRVVGNNITISLSGDDPVLADYFTGLAEGGQVAVPMAKQVWGDQYGQLVDKFGISWMVNLSAPAA